MTQPATGPATGPAIEPAIRPERGRFITLEGGEGVGKSTQAPLLAEALRMRGCTVVTTREPGGSAGAEAIRKLLLDAPANAWDARTEALLFAAARADHVRRLIAPALARGDWVLCDRFIDSTRAYQGAAGDLGDDAIMAIHRIGSDALMPDRTLLFALDADQAAERRLARQLGGRATGVTDRFEARDQIFHTRVMAAFEALAADEPARFRRIEAAGSVDRIAALAIDALADLLP